MVNRAKDIKGSELRQATPRIRPANDTCRRLASDSERVTCKSSFAHLHLRFDRIKSNGNFSRESTRLIAMTVDRPILHALLAILLPALGTTAVGQPSLQGSSPLLENLVIVAPAKPGSGWDELARAMRRALRASGHVRQIEIRNTPGANGINGLLQFVTTYRGAGNALLVGGLTMVQAARADGATASLEKITPIAELTSEFEVIAVPAGSDLQSPEGLIKALGAKPRLLPHVTICELEQQGVAASLANWRGVFAPPDLNAEEKATLNDLVDQMVKTQAWKMELVRHHWTGVYVHGSAFAQLMTTGYAVRPYPAATPPIAATKRPTWLWASQIWLLRNFDVLASVILALTAFAVVIMFRQRIAWSRREAVLSQQIHIEKENAELKTAEAAELLRGLSDQIDRQFDRWDLTVAEHEVALLLLKGLRHKEIAAIRGTSERTVRQQAITIYKKAGIEGRTDLAAFFLEDLLAARGASSEFPARS